LTPNTPQAAGGFSFGDILDAVNPLQHIPIVSNLFRAATGSQISSGSQIVGDTIFGALLPGGAIAGLISSAADVAVKQVSGSDIAQHVVDSITGTSASAAPVATPLVAGQVNAAPQQPLSVPPTPLISLNRHTAISNAQYQRAQAFDAINKKLLKIAV
jgi:hypothetical protein